MSNNDKGQALSLKTLLSNDKYIIPIYQRNYAWGKSEITQLILDIKEFFENSNGKNYYIGSLVCFKRENGDYELIDGQQRHTTISLINAVLKSKLELHEVVSSTNLKFDSRKNAQRFLEELYATTNLEEYLSKTNVSGIQNFKDAIDFIQEEFQGKEDIKEFAENFYNRVKFFKVEVPKDTDLNHYFEIMNNRGEQLEKHEIVKALLMGKINDKGQQEIFATIWTACSDMNNYVYFNLNSKNQTKLFSNGDLKVENFEDLLEKIETVSTNEDQSLSEILSKHSLPENFPKEEKYQKEKYKSIIDFPNFLLQVLKLKHDETYLDDKKLLKNFEVITNDINASDKSKEFIFDLLKYRTLFDKNIIKQDLSDHDESKQNWGIRKHNVDFSSTIKTFGKSIEHEDESENTDEEIVKLQTMLYYSNPVNANNNWLQKVLKTADFSIQRYIHMLFNMSKVRFDDLRLSYPEISIFNLYFIDFLLWKLYKEGNVSELEELSKKINRDLFSKFKFRQLNSKEHLFSQASIHNLDRNILNGLGNLCLISTSQNSAGNKENPSDKRERFKNDNSSLKRLIMFESFNDKWDAEQILNHEKEILRLIKWSPY